MYRSWRVYLFLVVCPVLGAAGGDVMSVSHRVTMLENLAASDPTVELTVLELRVHTRERFQSSS